MSWYVLEGPDDTGKSTLARELDSHGWSYYHAGPDDRLPLLAKRLSEVQDYENVVLDRAHLGEIVHNKLDRDIPTPEGWRRIIEAFLIEREAHCILLTERWPGTVGWENSPDRHRDLVQEFQEAASKSFLHWSRNRLDPVPRQADDETIDDGRWTTERWPDPEGLGTHRPLYWVLGEQQNVNAKIPWPLATHCGIELVWPSVDPRYGRVSNAYVSHWRLPIVESGPKDLHERWKDLGMPRVIALGKTTVKGCDLAEIPVWHELPHPQYWARFHNSELERYKHDLEFAILRAEREAMEVIKV